jgi:hypothetical protein
MEQLPRTNPAHFRDPAVAVGRFPTARVTVAWTPSNADSAPSFAPTEVELVAGLDAAPTTTWTCHQRFASNWVEAIASARSREVVLTAWLGDDLPAKHLVLELAERLTRELAATQPLIRVRFLPTAGNRRGARSRAVTTRGTKNFAKPRGI